jgi:quercetin dioxygenase-like cupin family protein
VSAFARAADAAAFSSEKMRKQNVFDSANMFCDVYGFEPGQSQTAHAHAGSDKVYYVIEGCAEIQIGGETRRLEAGGLAHAAPGVAHGVVNPGPGRLSLLVFMAPKP